MNVIPGARGRLSIWDDERREHIFELTNCVIGVDYGYSDPTTIDLEAMVTATQVVDPPRPEGAEEIEQLIRGGIGDAAPSVSEIADILAEARLRVPQEEH